MTYLVGQRLGRYEIQEEIGRGGMARVYRALDTSLRRTVALKVLAPQLAVDPEFAHRFEREAVTAANLHHPNIVGIYDVGEQDGVHYIAMEYLAGRSLFTVIEERGALGLGYAVSVVEAVASALDYAHVQGAVHRDVKPQNIMIDTDGRVLLTDFGIAQPPETDTRQERLTRTGVFMGTPEYISPEQASAERVDGRSDLYSLGIVTYEMITGAVPFSGSTLQIIVAHVQNEPPAPSSIVPDLPRELDMVLGRILAKQPAQRFASGAAFTSALRIVARKNLVPIATPAQMAALAVPRSSAGERTIRLGQTPSSVPAPRALPIPPTNNESTKVGASPLLEAEQPRRRPVPPRIPTQEPAPVRRSTLLPLPTRSGGIGGRIPWNIVLGVLGGVILILLFSLFGRQNNSTLVGPFPSPTRPFTAIASPVATFSSSTPTATSTPTYTPLPTEAPATAAPTDAPATNTLVPPTWTIAPIVNPPVPPTPEPPTLTPEPPTLTPAPPTVAVTSTVAVTPYPPPNSSTAIAPTEALTQTSNLLTSVVLTSTLTSTQTIGLLTPPAENVTDAALTPVQTTATLATDVTTTQTAASTQTATTATADQTSSATSAPVSTTSATATP